MNDIPKPENRNNLGGNFKLQILLFHDLFKIGDPIKGEISDLEVFDGSFIIDIECTIETINDIVKKKRRNNGIIFEVEIDAQIPKTRKDVRNELELLDNKKFVVVLYDNNGFVRLFGDLENPMRFSDDLDKRGRKAVNINAYQFTLSGEFPYRPYYITDDFEPIFITPLFQHIFDGAINQTKDIPDSSSFGNTGVLQDASCISIQLGGFINLPFDIDFAGYTISHSGTAELTLDIPNKQINVSTSGTIYNLMLTGSQNYKFPCSEGDLGMIHDTERGERAWISRYTWTFQSVYFHFNLLGADEIKNTADTSQRLFVPKNSLGGQIYNGKADNKWYAGINYLIDMIVKRDTTYYKCNTAHTSAVWDDETANWTAI